MSDVTREDRCVASGAIDVEAHAAAWLERRDREDWNAEDHERLGHWLAESTAHRLAFLRLHAAWSDADRLAVLCRSSPEMTGAYRRPRPILVKIAAAVVLAAVLGIAIAAYLLSPREQVYATPVGGRQIVKLADGSQIELNTDTVLRARVSSAQRKIWLDRGEAYFQIRHDAAHPFVVMAAGNRLLDLGTKFVVRRNADRLQVAMLEGRVRFYPANGRPQSQPSLLTDGDVVIATTNSISVTKKRAADLVVQLSWRRGLIVFKDTALADAVSELDRYNNRKLVILDPSVARRTISGTVAATDVEAFVRVARNILGLRVEARGDEIVISR